MVPRPRNRREVHNQSVKIAICNKKYKCKLRYGTLVNDNVRPIMKGKIYYDGEYKKAHIHSEVLTQCYFQTDTTTPSMNYY